MEPGALQQAADCIIALRSGGERPDGLPPQCRPVTVGEAHAIQDAAVAALGEDVVGWKTGAGPDGAVMRGAILQSRLWDTPARIQAALVPLLGVEMEVAFRLDHDFPARGEKYSREEVEAGVTALMVVEVVDSRFRDYSTAPLLDRTADFMSNGGLVLGPVQPGWRSMTLGTVEASLVIDGATVVSGTVRHQAGHPIVPAVALLDLLRHDRGAAAGEIITTGSYTGLVFAKPGQRVVATMAGFGSIEVVFGV